jgi:hypothetical protein
LGKAVVISSVTVGLGLLSLIFWLKLIFCTLLTLFLNCGKPKNVERVGIYLLSSNFVSMVELLIKMKDLLLKELLNMLLVLKHYFRPLTVGVNLL